MRIIAGTARSRPLAAPKGTDTRPTSDRARESLFNILAPRTSDARFLDLFAGSGAVGIEALSRGARAAVFVERQAGAAAVIRRNLQATGFEGCARVLALPASDALRYLMKRAEAFDIIFMDPPYASGLLTDTLRRLEGLDLLSASGTLVAEMPGSAEPPESAAYWLDRVKTCGGARFAFYRI